MKLTFKSNVAKLVVLVAFVLTIALLTGFLYLKDSVYVTDNNVTREIRTNETDMYAILAAEQYNIGEFDKVTEEVDENNSRYITITRAFEVNISVDASNTSVFVTEGTVRDLLEMADVALGEHDRVNFSLNMPVSAGMEIRVTRVQHVERVVDSVVEFETEYVDNSNLAIGTEKILTEGKNGVSRAVYNDIYADGSLEKTEIVSEEVVEQPVAQVIERGTACAVPYAKMEDPTALKLVNGIPESYTRVITGKSTAYSAKPGAKAASGRRAVVGTVAVNPNVIPYGSELYIVSRDRKHVYGYAVAADTGSGMMEGYSMIDLFTANYADSCKWGSHIVDVFVISEGNG